MDMIRGDSESVNKITKKSSDKKVINDCRYCGLDHVMKSSSCPAFGEICKKCKKKNHFANKCRTRNINNIDDSSDEEVNNIDEYVIQ